MGLRLGLREFTVERVIIIIIIIIIYCNSVVTRWQ